jgi:hypothetical protein
MHGAISGTAALHYDAARSDSSIVSTIGLGPGRIAGWHPQGVVTRASRTDATDTLVALTMSCHRPIASVYTMSYPSIPLCTARSYSTYHLSVVS